MHFDTSMKENDESWSPSRRETEADVQARVKAFLTWLCQQSQYRNIVVVSHGVWIEICLRMYGGPHALGKKRVHNCDAYATQLVSCNGQVVQLTNIELIR